MTGFFGVLPGMDPFAKWMCINNRYYYKATTGLPLFANVLKELQASISVVAQAEH